MAIDPKLLDIKLKSTPKLPTKKITIGKTTAIVLISVAVVTLGIFTYQYFTYQFEKLFDYCYKLTNLKIKSFTFKEAVISLSLKILNKSDIDVTIKKQNYTITVNGNDVSYINSTKPVLVKARQSTELPLTLTFNPMEVLKLSLLNFDQFLLNKEENIVIGIEGYFTGGAGFIIYPDYKISYKYTIKELLSDTGTEDCWKTK